jgi:competence protein ComEA
VDPKTMPWRTIESASTPGPSPNDVPPNDGSRPRISRGAIATLGAAALLVLGAFVIAFGSGGAGDVRVAGGVPLDSPSASGPGASVGGAHDPGRSDGPDEIVVEIVGAVSHPGVYRLPPGSRIGDLVDTAGGYSPRVDTDRATQALNRAAVLADGDQVRVPSRDDTEPPVAGGNGGDRSAAPGSGGLIDLNQATTSELDALPGIGPVTAGKIIAAREESRFATVDDLRTRKLVGEKTFEQLKPLVTVR